MRIHYSLSKLSLITLLTVLTVTSICPTSVQAYPVTTEAENMPTKTTGSSIPGGWNISSNGHIAANYNFALTGAYSFGVIASGTFANGAYPRMQLRIDGNVKGTVTVTTTSYYSIYLFTVNNIAAGVRPLAIAFTNDFYNPPADRNLFVDKIIIIANPGPAPTPVPNPPLQPSGCNGTSVFPGMDLKALVESSPFNTPKTYCIKTGTHNLSGTIIPHPSDSFIGEPGAILDGGTNNVVQAFLGYCVPNAQNYQDNVTIRGLTIQNFTEVPDSSFDNAAVKAGCNWIVEYNEIRNNDEVGVKVDRGTILRRNNIHHNGRYGVTSTPSVNANILIQENEIAYNNTRNLDTGDDAGGSKLVGATVGLTGVKWIRNWVHHNTGNGIWHDIAVGPNVEIAYNTVEYNTGSGIFVEISTGHDVHDNLVRFNDGDNAGQNCFFGSQIHNNDSSNVNVYRNYVESIDGSNGICLVDAIRSVPPPSSTAVTNCTVNNNTIKVKNSTTFTSSGMSGLVGDRGPYNLSTAHFEHNTYYVPSLPGRNWAFQSYPLNNQQWQGIGQDLYGDFLTW